MKGASLLQTEPFPTRRSAAAAAVRECVFAIRDVDCALINWVRLQAVCMPVSTKIQGKRISIAAAYACACTGKLAAESTVQLCLSVLK